MNKAPQVQHETKTKILRVATDVIRTKGFTATRVEDICAAAEITKGAFFHHFKSKEDMALQAAQFFSDFADRLFADAPFQQLPDPVDRILGYIDFRTQILQGHLYEFTCLLGTMAQEVYDSHPAIQAATKQHIWGHAETLVPTIQAAIDQTPSAQGQDAQDLALFTQAVLQGGFVLSKAEGSPAPARSAAAHLRRYFLSIFRPEQQISQSEQEQQ